jgi:hypothetical protein
MFWVDSLLVESESTPFWIKGSVASGVQLDPAAHARITWDWIGHINGNALYSLKDPNFFTFLLLVIQYSPPGFAFDVSIWRVLHTFPNSWRVYQRYRHMFQHSNFIANYGSNPPLEETEETEHLLINQGVVLLHGAKRKCTSRVPQVKERTDMPAAQDTSFHPPVVTISVFIVSNAVSVLHTVNAVAKYMPFVFEIVVVTSSKELFEIGTAAFWENLNARFVKPKITFPTLRLQRIFANLMADEYCNGDLVIPLKNGNQITRQVSQREVMWAYKPIVRYEVVASSSQERISNRTALVIGVDSPYFVPTGSVFPRELYLPCRSQLLAQMSPYYVIKSTTSSEAQDVLSLRSDRYFDELDYLAAFAWHNLHSAIAWWATGLYDVGADFPAPLIEPFLMQT